MTPERDEQREQLIDDVVERLIMGECIRYITDSGASKSVTMGDLLIKEVEDGNVGFKEFMEKAHRIMNNSHRDGKMRVDRIRMVNDRMLLINESARIARPWVEDYIEEIERAVIDEAADEDARRRFDDRQDVMNGGL